jgi:hypothetical protein
MSTERTVAEKERERRTTRSNVKHKHADDHNLVEGNTRDMVTPSLVRSLNRVRATQDNLPQPAR